jgi:glycine cleavage system H lipoate-binding protein
MISAKQIQAFNATQDPKADDCVWMDAGVVDYKLCDRNYDCEHCPFDEALHGQPSERRFAESVRVRGCEVAPGLFYDPSHVWLRIEENGVVRIGIDDFGQRLLGPAYSIVFPSEATEIKRGDSPCSLAVKSGLATLFAPVSGTIRQTNSSLALRPSLVNKDPYGSGWMILVEPTDLEESLKRLFYGKKVTTWMAEEVDKLNLLIGNVMNDEHRMTVTMQDGGLLVDEFLGDFAIEETRRVISSFFPLAISEAGQKSAIVFSDGR